MGSFMAKQPNGLLCRFSTTIDTLTHYNMTEEEYIEMCAEKAREEARDVLKNYTRPYEEVKEYFLPSTMSRKKFNQIVKKMESKREYQV